MHETIGQQVHLELSNENDVQVTSMLCIDGGHTNHDELEEEANDILEEDISSEEVDELGTIEEYFEDVNEEFANDASTVGVPSFDSYEGEGEANKELELFYMVDMTIGLESDYEADIGDTTGDEHGPSFWDENNSGDIYGKKPMEQYEDIFSHDSGACIFYSVDLQVLLTDASTIQDGFYEVYPMALHHRPFTIFSFHHGMGLQLGSFMNRTIHEEVDRSHSKMMMGVYRGNSSKKQNKVIFVFDPDGVSFLWSMGTRDEFFQEGEFDAEHPLGI
ncbi:uncharacterized protein LOC143853134 [Tasmannia lanceolata]|uniref:uncharacterized protein LOC143853134 n=1 Tax=Tasmannia lanceolata TaxID=3420 RepID=UPI004064C887